MEITILSMALVFALIAMTFIIVQKYFKKTKSSIDKYNSRINYLDNKLNNINSAINSNREKLSKIQSNTLHINESLVEIKHKLNILLKPISEFATVGEFSKNEKTETFVSPERGVIEVIDKPKSLLSQFIVHDRNDNKFEIGKLKKGYYKKVSIEEIFVQDKQKIAKNNKIVRIRFSVNSAEININNTGTILNLNYLKNRENFIKEGQELLIIEDEHKNIKRIMAPITGLYISELNIGDEVKGDDIPLLVYIDQD